MINPYFNAVAKMFLGNAKQREEGKKEYFKTLQKEIDDEIKKRPLCQFMGSKNKYG